MKKKDCSDCYIRVRRYTCFRGLWYTLGLTLFLIIPILNIYLVKVFHDGGQREGGGFWQGCWYDYIEEKVKQYPT